MRLVLERAGAPAGSWTGGLDGYSHREGQVFLPKLDLGWGEDITGALARVGIGPALGASADYSAALSAPLAGLAVVQKCVLKVDEQGAEAAAATAVIMAGAAAPMRNPPPPFVFRADRPFHLMLAETATGAPLILAYVAAVSAS
jgi:serpin B